MITCFFEDGGKAKIGLRHVTVGAIAFNQQNQVLLIKRSENTTRGGKYAIPGGFLDRDETIEAAVSRELLEETGYYGEIMGLFHLNDNTSRPYEDRQNVDFIYLVKVQDGEFHQNKEVTEIGWFDEATLPLEETFAFDHRATIIKFFRYQKNRFQIPIVGAL